MSNISKQIASLSPEKQAYLSQRLRAQKGTATRATIRRQSRETNIFGTSFAQQRLWLLDQLDSGTPTYNICRAFFLSGPLDYRALEHSLNEVVRRHETLRTTFTNVDTQPVQVIAPFVPVSLVPIQLDQVSEDEIKQLASKEARTPFDLSQGPLLRATLFRLNKETHVFILTVHHIVFDGWSMEILFRELSALYSAHTTGKQLALPELPIQYADYAHWQREWLQGERLATQQAYWKEQLSDLPEMLSLPTDRPRPAQQTFHGAWHTFTLSHQVSDELKALSKREGVTLFMTLLAVFKVLLYRYTGQEDLVLGSPIANRTRVEVEGLIGFFVNTLVLRTRLSADHSFRELLKRVSKVTIDAYAHQDLPFEHLVEMLQPARSLSYSPLYQVLFDLQNASGSELTLGNVTGRLLDFERGIAKVDLTLFMLDTEQGLQGILEYNTDLFEPATIQRMATHFQVLAETIAANPDCHIGHLPLPTQTERDQLLVLQNATQTDYPQEQCVHQLFELQAAQTPNAPALICGEDRLTYDELNRRANQLAHYLRQQGAGPEVLIGICLERSFDLIVGLLAILKAGGAYVPLDSSAPKDRLAFMLTDIQVKILLTVRKLAEVIPPHASTILCLDSEQATIAQYPDDNVPGSGSAAQLAYAMYTSGSTGKPKAVGIPHHAVVRLVKNTNFMDINEQEVFFQYAPVTFDASTLEIWGPLLNGARLAISPPHQLSLQELGAAIQQYQVTSLWLTTGLFHQMVEEQLESFRNLHQLLMGGEVISPAHVQKLLAGVPTYRMIHCYGPTENTTFTSTYDVPLDQRDNVSLPIGRPIANTTVYILDRYMQPVPVGVVGELYTGGAGLARGYLNRPELTAERFVPHPFVRTGSTTSEPGARLYRTGDLARYLPNGAIEFLGRIDHQVKIRGFRIEPAEIEQMLGQCPAVRECVVLAWEDTVGSKQLAAYVVGNGANALAHYDLRQYLQEYLPDYMVPSVFIELPSLPLTPNGKVDRRALPPPSTAQPSLSKTFVAPRTAIEELLTNIWSETLGVEQVSTQDNFFELGGHSLRATKVIARIRTVLQIELSLRELFENPTLAHLAARIEIARQATKASQKQEDEALPPLTVQVRPEHLPLSQAQRSLWFFYQLEPTSPFYNIPLALRLRNQLSVPALEHSLRTLMQRHEILRTVFVSSPEGEPEQLVRDTMLVALSLLDLQALPVQEREAALNALMQEELQRPFVLEMGPLFRELLVRLSEHEHILLLTFHHSIFDGWSHQLLLRELSALYEYYEHGGERDGMRSLPAPTLQYADYTLWQRQWLQQQRVEQQLAYWRSQLRDAPTVLNLPADHPRPPRQTFRGAVERFVLPPTVYAALKAISRREGVTLFTTLLATFSILLSRYCGQREVLIGSPVANRRDVETESMIGFFVNMLVLRCNLEGRPGFTELLQRIQATTLDAYDHQDVPFEYLVQKSGIERITNMHPFFQAVLALQNADPATERLGSVEATWLENHNATSKFDLALEIFETDQELRCKLEYSTDLFEQATIARMVQNFQTLLASVIAQPSAVIWEHPLLHKEELEQISEWSTVYADYPRESCIHELFEEQAQRQPDAIALTCGEAQMSYGVLERYATALACKLRELGVGPEVRVGTCFERSVEQIIVVLAILKAGGCYVPIEPQYPEERLNIMFENSSMALLLAQRLFEPRLSLLPMQVVYLDTLIDVDETPPAITLPNITHPDNLAHVLYTSGSTGKPKGVSVTHRNVARLVKNNNYARLDEHEVFVQYNPIAFDASTLEMWCSLLVGARLVIAAPGTPSLSELAHLFQQYAVTAAWITAGLFHQLVDHHLDALLSLRQVMTGGDVLSTAHVRRFLARADGSMLLNGYGPTENTVFTCCYPMTSPEEVKASVPIGRVIANTQLYVLDEEMQPAPIGVYGELYVGGDGLSRGYLRRPELTAERYVPHPFVGTLLAASEPGARLYRTGDIVRFVADGTLEFLGRTDFQVKVRGFRIELGEIETALQKHPQIQDAVVIVHQSTSGDKRLIAYVLMAPGGALEEAPMRDWLRTHLPEYMVPNRLIALETFPLSPNGKVDRRALPAPDEGPHQERKLHHARTPVEEILVNIWCEALDIQQIDIHDNFFECGGHSLLAMSIIARIRRHLGRDISLRTFLEHPTIAHLARCLEVQEHEASTQLPALAPQERPERVPLSLAQQRLWFICQLDPENPFYNIALALRLRGELHYRALESALGEMARRHEVLRTRILQEGGEPFQVINPFRSFVLPLASLEELPEHENEMLMLVRAERSRPFDLLGGALMRTQLLRLAAQEHVLLLTFHHLIFDGWSQQQFSRELATLYQVFAQGEPSPLAEPAVQYADYTLWQRQWLTEAVVEPQVRYWRELLHGVPIVLELPTDRPRPPVQTFRGAAVQEELPASLIAALQQLGRREGYTPFMLLMAAFGALLSRLSGQKQILLGTASANRHLVEFESLLGFCANTVLMCIDVRGMPSFRELLGRVRETVLQANAHQDVPFERLVEELAPLRSLSHNPLFQVGFGFWSQRNEQNEWGSVQVTRLSPETTTAKQDLMLDVVELPTGELLLQWDYNSDLFDRATIERWHSSLIGLLQAACTDADQPVARLPLLLPEQREAQCQQGRGEQVALPEHQGIHELIAWQASQQPETEALRFGERVWSYRRLQERVEQLARRLRAAGVGPEVLVGVYLERSPELIVAILSILSAGGAYVPLDVSYPQERLAYMCHDARISLLFTQEALRERVPVNDIPVIVLDSEGRTNDLAVGAGQSDIPLPATYSDQLAYVIYTSGSSGRPKGVMVAHQGVCSLVEAQIRAFGSQKGKRVLQFASLSFDASVWEIIMALGQGGTLVLAEQVQLIPGPALQAVLREQGINTATLSPSVLAALPEGDYPDLQQIIVAGEACGAEIVSRWSVGRSFFNAYGPTETTVCASVARCTIDGGRPPIGRAIANLELYVLDEHGELVPPGVPGELYVGGSGIARGYLGRAEQTAESFVPHPWSQVAGARLYRTKDQVCWRADRQLEYLGRLDQQVKIRGFRIELGEIEAVLRQQEEVHECVVIVREDEPGDKRLVGYVVLEAGSQVSMSKLRERARDVLPEYMVPGVLVQMEQLPITANAKIDLNRLPLPGQEDMQAEREFVAPTAQLEREIAVVWCEVLHLEKISIHDAFFDLGGHSLLLTRLQHRLSEKLEREIALVDLFRHTTVSTQAAFLAPRQDEIQEFKHVVGRAAARQQAAQRRHTLAQDRQNIER